VAEGGEPTLIRKLLIANRGEIARRIMRTCRQMGIATVAVFSDADERSLHVTEADEAVRLCGDAPGATYLNITALIEAAKRTGADAVHPGYGFLAENAGFAAACHDQGLVFVGPTPEVIARMGSKREARRLMAGKGISVIPGYDGDDQSNERLLSEAERIGYPIMIKASAGGGGKGMRIVTSPDETLIALAAARREAQSAFGNETLLLERAIINARHIEFQIFGDQHGALVHLGERECSIQRRHQKVIEETPSPGITPVLRERMAEAALAVGRVLGYTNAGTVEFILSPDGEFYFLEVNTRLQVEHPVTELVTGLDLVRWQIEIAEGRPLPLGQAGISIAGHAIEARLYAEDPAHSFLPSTGRLLLWREPEDVRVDAAVRTGDEITSHYDPLIAKISVHAATRQDAARRLAHAIEHTVALGVHTNGEFLSRTLRHPAFLAGDTTTTFIERFGAELLGPEETVIGDPTSPEIAALFASLARAGNSAAWQQSRWRNNPVRPQIERFALHGHAVGYRAREDDVTINLTPVAVGRYTGSYASLRGVHDVEVRMSMQLNGRITAEVNGHALGAYFAENIEGGAHTWWVALGGRTRVLTWISPMPEPDERGPSAGSLVAPMPGIVVALLVATGQHVRAGDPLMILEAMKMEHTIRAPWSGVVAATRFESGERVTAGAHLIDIEPLEESGEPDE
jgi:acetyl/propionyl-CoA carboxylase alpha subunit